MNIFIYLLIIFVIIPQAEARLSVKERLQRAREQEKNLKTTEENRLDSEPLTPAQPVQFNIPSQNKRLSIKERLRKAREKEVRKNQELDGPTVSGEQPVVEDTEQESVQENTGIEVSSPKQTEFQEKIPAVEAPKEKRRLPLGAHDGFYGLDEPETGNTNLDPDGAQGLERKSGNTVNALTPAPEYPDTIKAPSQKVPAYVPPQPMAVTDVYRIPLGGQSAQKVNYFKDDNQDEEGDDDQVVETLIVLPEEVVFNYIGQQRHLVVKGKMKDGRTQFLSDITKMSFRSDDPDIARAGAQGLIKAINRGRTKVTVRYGEHSFQVYVNVL